MKSFFIIFLLLRKEDKEPPTIFPHYSLKSLSRSIKNEIFILMDLSRKFCVTIFFSLLYTHERDG